MSASRSSTSFSYKNNILGLETQSGWRDLREIAKEQRGPFYLYSRRSIEERAQLLTENLQGLDFKIHYAMKANGNAEVLKVLKSKNCGVDVVSRGEAQWSLDNGFAPSDIIFSGVAKSKEDLRFAIDKELYQINVESLPELQRLGELARELKKTASVGIRINPNIKVDTHPYITTGFRENKFGIAEYQLKEALEIVQSFAPYVELRGLSSHIGSQIRELSPLSDAVASLLRTTNSLIQAGHPLTTIDLGGGLGINYSIDDETVELDMMRNFCAVVKEALKNFKGRVMMEPGRALVGRSGVLCAQVEYVKYNGYKDFIILNSGMNHLMRPSLYQAFHRILPLELRVSAPEKIYDVVGPICESSDVLGHNRQLHEPLQGDWLAIMDAGAYGMSMASFYNRHDFPAEVVV